MIWQSEQRKRPDRWDGQFHRVFLWRPHRVTSGWCAWLQTVERRWIVDDYGNWAGGYRGHWEYRWASNYHAAPPGYFS